MVRLLIPLVAIILIWLLFFSSFSKRIRIAASSALIALTLFGLWLDTGGRGISTSRVDVDQVVSCGVTGSYSYRTNYNLELCLQNNSSAASVRRLLLKFDAIDCKNGNCEVLDSVEDTVNLTIEPDSQIKRTENIAFDNVPEQSSDLQFAVSVLQVWASR